MCTHRSERCDVCEGPSDGPPDEHADAGRVPLRRHVPVRLPRLAVDPRRARADRARDRLVVLQPRGDQPLPGQDEVKADHDRVVATGGFGVPTMFCPDGQALFGPVLVNPPTGERAVALWEAFTAVVDLPEVYESHRPRGPVQKREIADSLATYLGARDLISINRGEELHFDAPVPALRRPHCPPPCGPPPGGCCCWSGTVETPRAPRSPVTGASSTPGARRLASSRPTFPASGKGWASPRYAPRVAPFTGPGLGCSLRSP